MLAWEGDNIWMKLWSLIRSILTLARFDLFLQGTLLILTLLEGYAYLLLRRSAASDLLTEHVEDWVFMGAAGAEFVFGALLAWYGRGRRHLALAVWLMMVAASGLVVLAFPQPDIIVPDVELCNTASSLPTITDEFGSARAAFIIITAVLCSLARISVWSHGVSYLDDHEPANGAYFYGILISIRISVGTNARSWMAPHSRSQDWWKGQLSLSMLTLMFGILFTLFPKRMGGWKKETVGDDGFFETLGRVVKNKVVITQTLALALLTTGIWGFVFHEPDYARARFHIEGASQWSDGRSSRLVGDILRSFVIIFFVAIFRARFSGRRPEGVKASTASKVGAVVAFLAAAFFAVIILLASLGCGTDNISGLSSGDMYQQPDCSQQCGCNSEKYGFAPVCAVNTQTTFFSPCHAGCNEYEDLNGFLLLENCTCTIQRVVQGACDLASCRTSYSIYQVVYVNALALSGNLEENCTCPSHRVVEGACDLASFRTSYSIYQVVYVNALAPLASALLMQGMVVLRAVRPSDKTTAIGATFGVIALLAHVPGHYLYIYISDITCVYKDGANCLFHSHLLPTALAGLSSLLILLSAVISFIAFFMARRQDVKEEAHSLNGLELSSSPDGLRQSASKMPIRRDFIST